MDKSGKKLADTVASPIIKAYQTGGLALTFVTAGTILLVIAVSIDANEKYILTIVGTAMISLVLIRYWLHDVRTLKETHKTIKSNADLLNSIQSIAIQMTDLSSHLQTLAFKHADQIDPLLTKFRETARSIAGLPFVGNTEIGQRVIELADHKKVALAQGFAESVIAYTESAKVVIEDIRIALVTLDPEPLKTYKAQIEELDKQLTEILKKNVTA